MTDCSHKDYFDFSESKLLIPAYDSSWRLFLYSCPHCFDALWNQPPGQDQKFLILWDGYPDENKPSLPSILDFITPLDWALAATYQALPSDGASSSAKSDPLPEVAILDLHSHRCPGSFAVNMRLALRDALPNVELFHGFDRFGNDFLRAVEFLSMPPNNSLTADNVDPTKLNALRQAWLGYTAKSRDHHDINNIVGVQILQEAYGVARSEKQSPTEHALQQSVRWLNFAGETGKIQINKEKQIRNCDIFLLDDRAEDGWLQILDKYLDKSQEGISRLYYATNPQALLNDLSGSSGKWLEFLKQDLPNKASSLPFANRNRIFLIDLRLFVFGRQEEENFFYSLSEAVLASKDPNITDDVRRDAQKIYDLINKGGKISEQPNIDYDRLLSLLARFIACKGKGHTLPIILFSSTGKRSVVEPLKDYKNIITCAPKPQCLAGLSGELIQGFSINLSQAFQQAKRILKANDVIQRIKDIAEKHKEDNSTLTPGENEHFHVELYLDEVAQKDKFEVGGCYAIFKGTSRDDAIRLSWQFDDELVKNGIYFFYRNGAWPDIPDEKHPLPKEPALLDEFKTAFKSVALDFRPVEIGFVRLRKIPRQKTVMAGIDPDNRQLLHEILETFLYEACPAMFGADWATKAFSFSVFGGTRNWPSDADELKCFTYRFGVGVREFRGGKGKELYVRSMYADGLVPFVVDLESMRGSLGAVIERIWAVRLIYEIDSEGDRDIGVLQRVLCLVCGRSLEAKPAINSKIAIVSSLLDDKNGKQIAFLETLDFSTNGKDVFVPPRFANEIYSNLNCTYFRYEATSNDMSRWTATKVTPVLPGMPDEQQIEKERTQGTWTIVKEDWQTPDPCPHSRFRPDYKVLHYMADWALKKPNEFPFKGQLYFDEAIDGDAFICWRHAGRALDAGDRPRALREAKEALCTSTGHQDLEKSTGKFVILRLFTSLKNITREEFFKFVDSLDQPLDRNRTAPTKPVNISQGITVVLSGFSDEINENNVVSRVSKYLRSAGFYTVTLEGSRSKRSGNVTCKLHGVSREQLEAIKSLKIAVPSGPEPLWRNINTL